jgi:hypothetical protein
MPTTTTKTTNKLPEFDPKSRDDALALGSACEQFGASLNKLADRRLKKAGKKSPKLYMIEVTAQFLVARRVAEMLLEQVVTDDNAEFLRLVIDKEKELRK